MRGPYCDRSLQSTRPISCPSLASICHHDCQRVPEPDLSLADSTGIGVDLYAALNGAAQGSSERCVCCVVRCEGPDVLSLDYEDDGRSVPLGDSVLQFSHVAAAPRRGSIGEQRHIPPD